ncbi:transcription elongation factor GreA [Aerococcaceae bacterium DSM 111176]|nr:transcription elongation factor GreA [Aerococcaceae bacterium DSM 111176]
MNDQKTYPMTAQGKAKLEAELEDLKVNKRKEIIERIKVARSFGDLSENSEYESARDEQAMLEGRIATMENQIRFAEIIDDKDVAADEVTLGRKVTFVELPDGDEESYTIVGSAEADPMDFKISNDSPIAKAILGKKIGDQVSIESPGGAYEVEIVKVENAGDGVFGLGWLEFALDLWSANYVVRSFLLVLF